MGGLAVAGRLAAAGASVRVFEKNAGAGGRVGEFEWGGHRWETGASLLLLPDVYKETFAAIENGDADDAPCLERVSPSYAIWFNSHAARGPVDLGGDRAALTARLELEGENVLARFDDYLVCAREYLRAGWPLFIEESVAGLSLVPRFLGNALSGAWRWPLQSHDAALRRLFPDEPRMRALCAFDDLYVGLSPYNAPSVFSLLAAIELDDATSGPRPDAGVFYPMGGFGGVVRRLEAACLRRGVDFEFNAPIRRVVLDGRTAVGVEAEDGRFWEADHVVVNADLTMAEPALLGDKARETYNDKDYSTSSVTFLWAFNRTVPALRHHNVFLAQDDEADDPFRKAWDFAFPTKPAASDPGLFHFYVCAPSKTDTSAAPPGAETVMVLVPVPGLADDGSDDGAVDALVSTLRRRVLDRLEADAACGPLEPCFERVIDPREWRGRLGLRRGAVFGLSHGLGQLAVFRPARRSSAVDNLSFVGASTRPGNGVPLVLTSARLLAEELERDLYLGND
ncbi:hypothetical protein M885DRAFT_554068 [Pelagophyceae sp. CCMP2097]|nr:hypothetical protein M885DRAFT_554068 [Pelagophyceae sp. CCMP2097]